MRESLESKWRADLAFGVPGVQLAQVDHPLEIYYGSSDFGNARLQVKTSDEPPRPHLADLVLVEKGRAGEGWLLTFTLQDQSFSEVFLKLGGHIVARTESATSEALALQLMAELLDQWRRLLTPAPPRRLGIDSLRGLVGELWFLLNYECEERSIDEALAGWSGPLGAPQDFWFDAAGYREIKSVGPTAKTFRVANELQLDEPGMELVVLIVPQVTQGSDSTVSLIDLVSDVRSLISEGSGDDSELRLRLLRLGVDLEDPYYADTYFEIVRLSRYEVTPAFPAIRGSELSGGISRVNYEVSLSAIVEFERETVTFQEAMK